MAFGPHTNSRAFKVTHACTCHLKASHTHTWCQFSSYLPVILTKCLPTSTHTQGYKSLCLSQPCLCRRAHINIPYWLSIYLNMYNLIQNRTMLSDLTEIRYICYLSTTEIKILRCMTVSSWLYHSVFPWATCLCHAQGYLQLPEVKC